MESLVIQSPEVRKGSVPDMEPGRARGMGDAPVLYLMETTVLALWLGCTVVGVLGLVLHYPGARVPTVESPAVVAEQVHVELTNDPSIPDPSLTPDPAPAEVQPAPQPDEPQPPAPAEAASPSESPPLVAVAVPSPAVAFAVPTNQPSRVVDARQAGPPPPDRPVRPTPPNPKAVRHLIFGVGEGAQPNPEYPREAIVAHQQGTVGIRFTIGPDGKVTSAEVAAPTRFPLLNQAAARCIREQWRFAPGPVRYREISIEFQLQ